MNILIAGCGYVGGELARRLVLESHAVWGLRRNTAALPGGVRPFTADLRAPETLRAFPARFDFVFYTAGSGDFSDEAYRAAYVEGPRNLLRALADDAQPVRRIFFTSSTGVYHQDGGAWCDEDTPVSPPRFSGARLLEGERTFQEGPFPATVLRLGGIYGPGRTRLIDQVRQGTARCVEGRTVYLNLIHRDDCAGVLRHVMGLDAPAPCYVAVDEEPVERCALLCWIAAQLGLPEPPAVSADEAGEPQRGGNRRLSNARLRASGYAFAFPTFREGYRTLL